MSFQLMISQRCFYLQYDNNNDHEYNNGHDNDTDTVTYVLHPAPRDLPPVTCDPPPATRDHSSFRLVSGVPGKSDIAGASADSLSFQSLQ